MLSQQKVNSNTYICNLCGKHYTLEDMIQTKGNHFMCSMKCILEYSLLYDIE